MFFVAWRAFFVADPGIRLPSVLFGFALDIEIGSMCRFHDVGRRRDNVGKPSMGALARSTHILEPTRRCVCVCVCVCMRARRYMDRDAHTEALECTCRHYSTDMDVHAQTCSHWRFLSKAPAWRFLHVGAGMQMSADSVCAGVLAWKCLHGGTCMGMIVRHVSMYSSASACPQIVSAQECLRVSGPSVGSAGTERVSFDTKHIKP